MPLHPSRSHPSLVVVMAMVAIVAMVAMVVATWLTPRIGVGVVINVPQ